MTIALEAVRRAIQENAANWEAGETPIRLQPNQGMHRLGLRTSPETVRRLLQAADRQLSFRTAQPPPPEIDWRNHQGENWITPIRDQGDCGACVAFATNAVLEARHRIERKDASLAIDLSEAHLFFCGCGRCCDDGWDFEPALTFCRDNGVGNEADFPYTGRDVACERITPRLRVTGWETDSNAIERKRAILNGPVLAAMEVYEDFSYYRGGIYRHVSGALSGLHAVAVVGYSDPQHCWIVKNSWGTAWGERGFFRMRYGECGLDSRFPFFDVEVAAVPVS